MVTENKGVAPPPKGDRGRGGWGWTALTRRAQDLGQNGHDLGQSPSSVGTSES